MAGTKRDERPITSACAVALSSRDRSQLVESHLELVYTIAAKIHYSINRSIELDDLVAFGTEGLIHAATRFDEDRGATFSTFAYARIHGAIYDGIRELSPLPSTIYRRLRAAKQECSCESLPTPANRPPVTFVTSLDAHLDRGNQVARTDDSNAENNVVLNELCGMLQQAVKRLSRRERQLIQAYYFDDKTLQDTGRELGISKSWACRLHTRAIDQLRNSMATVGMAA